MIIYNLEKNNFYNAVDYERRRAVSAQESDARDPFEKDYGRIIHSAAFRRLQAKTQVLGLDVGDFHRTRLTHSMEVAQIARGMAIKLNASNSIFKENYLLDASLVEAAALAHDIGHPPFGHQGEDSLHACMQKYGGFESNAHTFRILTRLEGDGEYGLNVTRAMLLAVMKYPLLLDDATNTALETPHKPLAPKSGAFVCDNKAFDWVMSGFSRVERAYLRETHLSPRGYNITAHKTIECSIIELADDIAYGTHDIEDSLHLNLVHFGHLQKLLHPFRGNILYPKLSEAYENLSHVPFEENNRYKLKVVLSSIIFTFIANVQIITLNKHMSTRLKYKATLPTPLNLLLEGLQSLVADKVIDSQRVRIANSRGSHVIERLFNTIMDDDRLLPVNDRCKLEKSCSDARRARIVCDYIAGMTDSFALKMYERLFGQSRNFDYF